MSSEQNRQKQSGDRDETETAREGFSAEELGEASIYDDQTQIAQQMRRGDESKGDPDARDHVGASDVSDTNEARQDQDTTANKDAPA